MCLRQLSFFEQEFRRIGDKRIGFVRLPVYGSLRLDELLFIERSQPKSTRQIIESEARLHSALSDDLIGAYNLLLKAMRGELEDADATDEHLVKRVESLASKLRDANQRTTELYAVAMIRYRGGKPDVTLKNVQLCEGLHPALIEAIADFGREEARGDREPQIDEYLPVSSMQEIVSKSLVPEPSDWYKIMLTLGRYFPQMQVFSDEHEFVKRSTHWISWMLGQGVEMRRQELHELEIPIAFLRKTLIQANSRNPSQVKVEDLFLFKSGGTDLAIPAEVCNIFFALSREDALPEWAHTFELVEQMRKHQNSAPLVYPRALIGEGIYILRYQVKAGAIHAAFVGAEACKEWTEVKDPDSGVTYFIKTEAYEDGFYTDEVIEISDRI